MARLLIVLNLIWFSLQAKSQVTLQSVLDSVAHNNLSIQASFLNREAETLKAKTGITPPDPEASYGYFPGITPGTGTKTTFSIMQSFDFPLVYARRMQRSALEGKQHTEIFRNEKRQVMYDAASTFIECVYLEHLIREFTRRANEAAGIMELTLKSMDAGNSNQIELNKAHLEKVRWRNDLNLLKLKKQQEEQYLATLNNGKPFDMSGADFPYWSLPEPDSVYQAALVNDPVVRALEFEVMMADNNKKLQQSLWLPKISAGYGQEITPDEAFKGFQAGLSLPLWQNKNTVKYARLQEESAKSRAMAYKQQLSAEIINNHQSASALHDNLVEYQRVLATIKTADLLKKSLDSGNISVLEYYRELIPWYEAIDQQISTLRDYHSELLKLMLYYW